MRRFAAERFIYLQNPIDMLDISSCLHIGPAPFGSPPIDRGVEDQDARLDRARRACLSLREGVEACCMHVFRQTHILAVFVARITNTIAYT